MQAVDPSVPVALAVGVEGVEPELVQGAVIATRHPTGWFVHGVRSRELSTESRQEFAGFVNVRVYLLLSHGPSPPAWVNAPGHPEWRALWVPPRQPSYDVPDALPSIW